MSTSVAAWPVQFNMRLFGLHIYAWQVCTETAFTYRISSASASMMCPRPAGSCLDKNLNQRPMDLQQASQPVLGRRLALR
jgi:hypothetical protein